MKVKELFEDNIPTYTTKQEVIQWCENKSKNEKLIFNKPIIDCVSNEPPYKISSTMVNFAKTAIFKKPLPVHFLKIGSFYGTNCKYLTSLNQLNIDNVNELYLAETDLVSLENCPNISLKGAFSYTPIKSLKGLSENVKILNISSCKQLTLIDEYLPSLTRLIAPASGLTSLKNIHKMIPNVEHIQINANPITSNILGLLKLPKLQVVVYQTGTLPSTDFEKAYTILKKYLDSKDILACQDELIENGYKDFAKL